MVLRVLLASRDLKDSRATLVSKVYKAHKDLKDSKVCKVLEFKEHKAIRVYKVPLVHRVLSEHKAQSALRVL